MINSKYRRRIEQLEAQYQQHLIDTLIPFKYLLAAVPPMSADARVRFEAWCEQLESTGTVPGADAPAPIDDLDLAIWIVRYVPTDLTACPSAAAGLLTEAYWHRDRERRGDAFAWKNQAVVESLEKQIAARW